MTEYFSKIAFIACLFACALALGQGNNYREEILIHGGYFDNTKNTDLGSELNRLGNLGVGKNIYMRGTDIIWGKNQNLSDAFPNGSTLNIFQKNVGKIAIGASKTVNNVPYGGAEITLGGTNLPVHLMGNTDIFGTLSVKNLFDLEPKTAHKIGVGHPSYNPDPGSPTHNWTYVSMKSNAQVVDLFREQENGLTNGLKEINIGSPASGTLIRLGGMTIDTQTNTIYASSGTEGSNVGLFTSPAEVAGLPGGLKVTVNIGNEGMRTIILGNLVVKGWAEVDGVFNNPGGGSGGIGGGTGGSRGIVPSSLSGMSEIMFDDEYPQIWNEVGGIVYLFSYIFDASQWKGGRPFNGVSDPAFISNAKVSPQIILGNASDIAIGAPSHRTRIIGNLEVGEDVTFYGDINILNELKIQADKSLEVLSDGKIAFKDDDDGVEWNQGLIEGTKINGSGIWNIRALDNSGGAITSYTLQASPDVPSMFEATSAGSAPNGKNLVLDNFFAVSLDAQPLVNYGEPGFPSATLSQTFLYTPGTMSEIACEGRLTYRNATYPTKGIVLKPFSMYVDDAGLNSALTDAFGVDFSSTLPTEYTWIKKQLQAFDTNNMIGPSILVIGNATSYLTIGPDYNLHQVSGDPENPSAYESITAINGQLMLTSYNIEVPSVHRTISSGGTLAIGQKYRNVGTTDITEPGSPDIVHGAGTTFTPLAVVTLTSNQYAQTWDDGGLDSGDMRNEALSNIPLLERHYAGDNVDHVSFLTKTDLDIQLGYKPTVIHRHSNNLNMYTGLNLYAASRILWDDNDSSTFKQVFDMSSISGKSVNAFKGADNVGIGDRFSVESDEFFFKQTVGNTVELTTNSSASVEFFKGAFQIDIGGKNVAQVLDHDIVGLDLLRNYLTDNFTTSRINLNSNSVTDSSDITPRTYTTKNINYANEVTDPTLALFANKSSMLIGAQKRNLDYTAFAINGGLVQLPLIDSDGMISKEILATNTMIDGKVNAEKIYLANLDTPLSSVDITGRYTKNPQGFKRLVSDGSSTTIVEGQNYRVLTVEFNGHVVDELFQASSSDKLAFDSDSSGLVLQWEPKTDPMILAENQATSSNLLAGHYAESDELFGINGPMRLTDKGTYGSVVRTSARPTWTATTEQLASYRSLNTGILTGRDSGNLGFGAAFDSDPTGEYSNVVSTLATSRGTNAGFVSEMSAVSPVSYGDIKSFLPNMHAVSSQFFNGRETNLDLIPQISPAPLDTFYTDPGSYSPTVELLAYLLNGFGDSLLINYGRTTSEEFTGMSLANLNLGYNVNTGISLSGIGSTTGRAYSNTGIFIDTISSPSTFGTIDQTTYDVDPTTVDSARVAKLLPGDGGSRGVYLKGFDGGNYRAGIEIDDVYSAFDQQYTGFTVVKDTEIHGDFSDAARPDENFYAIKTANGKVEIGGEEVKFDLAKLPTKEPVGASKAGVLWVDTDDGNSLKVARSLDPVTVAYEYTLDSSSYTNPDTAALAVTITGTYTPTAYVNFTNTVWQWLPNGTTLAAATSSPVTNLFSGYTDRINDGGPHQGGVELRFTTNMTDDDGGEHADTRSFFLDPPVAKFDVTKRGATSVYYAKRDLVTQLSTDGDLLIDLTDNSSAGGAPIIRYKIDALCKYTKYNGGSPEEATATVSLLTNDFSAPSTYPVIPTNFGIGSGLMALLNSSYDRDQTDPKPVLVALKLTVVTAVNSSVDLVDMDDQLDRRTILVIP